MVSALDNILWVPCALTSKFENTLGFGRVGDEIIDSRDKIFSLYIVLISLPLYVVSKYGYQEAWLHANSVLPLV